MASSESSTSEIPAIMRTLGDKKNWRANFKRLSTLMLSRCSATSNHGFPVLPWMSRACPERVKAGTCMSDAEWDEWNDTKKRPNGKEAIQKANETLYTTMNLMTDDQSEGGLAMGVAVDTGEIPIGDGFLLLHKFFTLFKQDAASMEDADSMFVEITNFKSKRDESAQAMVARFNALITSLIGKDSSLTFPDLFLQQRFLRALTTAGVRDYSNVQDQHHRKMYKDLAALQQAVLDEEIVLLKKASFESGNGNSSSAAAAGATEGNLPPVRAKAEKRKAAKARRRTRAQAASGSSTSTDAAACAADGTKDAKTDPAEGTGAGGKAPPTNKTCYSCGEVGHIAPHCPYNGAAARNTTEKVWCSYHNKHGYHLESECSWNPNSAKGKGKGKGKGGKGKGKYGRGGYGRGGYGRGGYGGYPAAYNSHFHAHGGKGDKGKGKSYAAVHQPYDPWTNAPQDADDLYELQDNGYSFDY